MLTLGALAFVPYTAECNVRSHGFWRRLLAQWRDAAHLYAAWLCFKEKGETDVQLLQQQQAVLYDTTNLMWKGVASGETEVCGRHSPHTALATQDQTFGGLGRPYGKCR